MNYVAVRTKLQAAIVLRLIELELISRPFVFVPLYQFHQAEDSRTVYDLYRQISTLACDTRPLVESDGAIRNTVRFLMYFLRASLTGGSLYYAVINSYPAALALRLVPMARPCTFDDGAANLEETSAYFRESGLDVTGMKRLLLRVLLPGGAAKYVRGRIMRHFSIYPNRPNIADPHLVTYVDLDWTSQLSAEDRDKLQGCRCRKILLGTAYEDLGDRATWVPVYEQLTRECDLYLPHPREKGRPRSGIQVLEMAATAEAVIQHLLQQSAEPICVYHFNSSIAYSLQESAQLRIIDALGNGDWQQGRHQA